MAIDNQFGKGIGVAAGFDLGAQKPLDARIAVNTIAERDAHVTENRAYEGMIVFVDADKKTYQLINGAWQELAKAEQDRLDALEAMLAGGEGAEGGALGALQDAIDDVQENLDKAVEDIEGAMSTEAARVNKKIADDIAAESALRVAEEQRIEKALEDAMAQEVIDRDAAILVETQRAEKAEQDLEDALNNEIERAGAKEEELQGLIATEKGRAEQAEAGLQSAIDAINDEENGILAKAKALDKADRDAQALVDKAQDDRLKALEDANKDGGAVKEAIDQVQANLDAFEEAQETAHNKLAQDMATESARVDQKIADDIAAESALRVAEEQRIEAKLDKAKTDLQKEIDDDVAAEAALRTAEEAKIREELANALKAAKEYADQKDTADKEAQSKFDAAQNSRIDALEAANAEGGAVKKAIDQVAQDLADFEAAQATKEQAQDNKDAALQKAIEDEASRADLEEKRIVGLLETEKSAREAADTALGARLDVIEGEAEGSIKKAVADEKSAREAADQALQTAISTEKGRAEAKEQELQTAISTEKTDREAADTALQTAINTEKQRAEGKEAELQTAIDNEKTAREQADTGLDTRLKAVEASIGDGGDLEKRVEANEAAIEKINGEGEGSIKKAVADLVDGAPQDLDTLKELSAALRDNKDVLTAIETAFDGKLATLQEDVDQNEADCDKAIADEQARAEGQEAAIRGELAKAKSDLQAEIDADVKVVADELAKQKDAAQEGTLANLIADEVARADAAEKANKGLIEAEASRADAAEKALAGKITALFAAYDGDTEYDDLAPLS